MLLHDALSRDLRLEKGFAPAERCRNLNYLRALPFGTKITQFLVVFICTNKKFALEYQLVGEFVRIQISMTAERLTEMSLRACLIRWRSTSRQALTEWTAKARLAQPACITM